MNTYLYKYIYIYVYIRSRFKRKTEAQAIFLNPFTVCSSCQRKFCRLSVCWRWNKRELSICKRTKRIERTKRTCPPMPLSHPPPPKDKRLQLSARIVCSVWSVQWCGCRRGQAHVASARENFPACLSSPQTCLPGPPYNAAEIYPPVAVYNKSNMSIGFLMYILW